jgi:hypothetical protein
MGQEDGTVPSGSTALFTTWFPESRPDTLRDSRPNGPGPFARISSHHRGCGLPMASRAMSMKGSRHGFATVSDCHTGSAVHNRWH